jgi:lysozyme
VFKISKSGISKIKDFEGFKPLAYEDPFVPGLWTIGYGETDGVKRGDVITSGKATTKFLARLDTLYHQLDATVHPRLSQGQSDALYSLVYNVGVGKFWHSKLYAKLNQLVMAPAEMLDWCHDGKGNVIPGLKKRRDWEYWTFMADAWPV